MVLVFVGGKRAYFRHIYGVIRAGYGRVTYARP